MNHFRTILFILLFFNMKGYSQQSIHIGSNASVYEKMAAKELQRYIYLLYGEYFVISAQDKEIGNATFIIGTPVGNPSLFGKFSVGMHKDNPGNQGYMLKKVTKNGKESLLIAANDDIGCLYGVYGLLDDYYQVGFYLGGDVLPEKQSVFKLVDVDEIKTPLTSIRGILPWTNFPQSATVYSWKDWQFILGQMAKMRMNMLHIHNYNGQNNHNEMFHNFSYKGFMSRVWMPTASTGHFWACPPWDVNQYRFGASELFDDYDFGADCALHNETLSNEEVFRKGVNLFQRVIDYAHQRSIKVALGLDIDLISSDYKANAYDDEIIDARVDQILTDYPALDYLVMFVSEMINEEPEKLEHWKYIFSRIYHQIKEKSPGMQIAVSGWGLRRELAQTLPKDVIAAPISTYTSGFEDGSIYGEREYWGCPWLERDMFSSNYYYPYEMDLSETIKAWKKRAPNMTGLYCLSWRLTDAVDAKMSYLAKAPWDHESKFDNSYEVYRQYAERNYGKEAAPDITDIINQNEPVSSKSAECQGTARFTGEPIQDIDFLYNLKTLKLNRYDRTIRQLKAVDYNDSSGITTHSKKDGTTYVQQINHGDWIQFKQIDFGLGITEFTAEVSTSNPAVCIEMHLDSLTGPACGTVEIDKVIGWARWREMKGRTFHTSGVHDVYFVFKSRLSQTDPYQLATEQLKTIDKWIRMEENPDHVRRLKMLRCRIAASQNFMDLNINFPEIRKAGQLPSLFPDWMSNFTHRVSDISSLGTIQSVQNRYVKLRYVGKEQELLDSSEIKFPTEIKAEGLKNGAVITWTNNEPDLLGTNIYRNQVKINHKIIPAQQTSYVDITDGKFDYQVEAVTHKGARSELSATASCYSGKSDRKPPHIVCVSPPGSGKRGQKVEIKVHLLDNRSADLLQATLFYKYAAEKKEHSIAMTRKTSATFTADIVYQGGLLEYYIKATDGKNESLFPASAPSTVLSLIEDVFEPSLTPDIPQMNGLKKGTIGWKKAGSKVHRYHIYRSVKPGFIPSSSTYLCYVSAETDTFRDNGKWLDGSDLKGKYYYCVTAVDKDGHESLPGETVMCEY